MTTKHRHNLCGTSHSNFTITQQKSEIGVANGKHPQNPILFFGIFLGTWNSQLSSSSWRRHFTQGTALQIELKRSISIFYLYLTRFDNLQTFCYCPRQSIRTLHAGADNFKNILLDKLTYVVWCDDLPQRIHTLVFFVQAEKLNVYTFYVFVKNTLSFTTHKYSPFTLLITVLHLLKFCPITEIVLQSGVTLWNFNPSLIYKIRIHVLHKDTDGAVLSLASL